ncbi:MAG: hypothetical protein COU31_04790 [Candidatus Magasanikbacteria bacterium CG10_big_fil_rev_8_21_14_0_10_40_10]|uniref:YoaR-like putative peptidoglycan binding domain-containing protein n=1 Tax=Candidatus Magasanikbacteria bacterium CG10_big_fil_rev_8_21_14_0_10_40_10 TaxID=1974648 RepID=A0A2M6W2P8_9BACT|nr:MAG: hypothetical protein COU31_04790 [Candidatus Magasanikbacteria bacterium CG10_big_fil_rev_8_21_14_0_10_40_10]
MIKIYFDQKPWLKAIGIVILVLLGVFLISGLGSWAYQQAYAGQVYRGVYIGQIHLGGMDKDQVKNFAESMNNRLVKDGLNFKFVDQDSQVIDFKLSAISSGEGLIDLVKINSDKLAQTALSAGRTGSFFTDLYLPVSYALGARQTIKAEVGVTEQFITNLKTYLTDYTDSPTDAKLVISGLNPFNYKIEPEKSGVIFDYANAKIELVNHLAVFDFSPIQLQKQNFSPTIIQADVSGLASKVPGVVAYGNLSLNYIDAKTKLRRDWTLTPEIYKDWIKIKKDSQGRLVIGLDQTEVNKYLKGLKPLVEQEALDAKFVMKDGKVNKFQASQNGIAIDMEKTFNDLDVAFIERNFAPKEATKSVSVSVTVTEPKIKMGQANDLGISEIIGVGVSTFYDSHNNRISNIANAVSRLNGTLIRPGENFSTNKYAGPYTTESGYLPEEVIVGNKIQKEVGGGMCQIGTTLFRMAMNSGMPIAQRVNHSLVVSYYADPVNGNPGTDATVYEPYVDFKFTNDTGNYLLLQTEINYNKQQLTFTLWGKNDGRSGSYTHPLVSAWYSPGNPIINKTTKLAVGVKTCQSAFTGAKASFTYTRFTSSSQKIDQIFESYYRPLPQICELGVDKDEYCAGEGKSSEDCKGYTASTTVAIET